MAEVKSDPIAEELRRQYPGNSILPKKEPQQSPSEPIKPVVKGKTSIGKEKFREKFKRTFIQADVKDVMTYAVQQLIIPSAKNIFLSALSMALFGRPNNTPWYGTNTSIWNGGNYTQYSYQGRSTSTPPWQTPNNQPAAPKFTQQNRAAQRFSAIQFNLYEDCEDVITSMIDYLERNGEVTVGVFYQLCNIQPTNVDELWGWRSFNKLEPRAIRGGYCIDISPAPIQLR